MHPSCLRNCAPQSGQAFPRIVGPTCTGPPIPSSIALAIASGQERTFTSSPFFLALAVERHRMPRSCSMSSLGSTPDRRATETALHVASDCDGQPPALPRLAKTSHSPRSSLFTVTNSVPQPMRNLEVLPLAWIFHAFEDHFANGVLVGSRIANSTTLG